jgi:hypothetical protein
VEYNDDKQGENFIEVSFTYVALEGTKTSTHLIIIVGNVGPVNKRLFNTVQYTYF